MKRIALVLSLLLATNVMSQDSAKPTPDQVDFLGITNPDRLSAASKRALNWPDIGNEWFVEFQTQDLQGDFAYEEGVVRRDPSAMIKRMALTTSGILAVSVPRRDLVVTSKMTKCFRGTVATCGMPPHPMASLGRKKDSPFRAVRRVPTMIVLFSRARS